MQPPEHAKRLQIFAGDSDPRKVRRALSCLVIYATVLGLWLASRKSCFETSREDNTTFATLCFLLPLITLFVLLLACKATPPKPAGSNHPVCISA